MSELETGAAPEAAVSESTPAPEVAAVETPVATETVEAAKPDLDTELSKIYRKHNPLRDDVGKYATDNPITDQKPETAPIEPAKPAIDPPVSWSAEAKAKWASVPPETQAFIAQRETEAHRRISELGQKVSTFEPFANVVEQHRDLFQKHNTDPATGISQLLAAQRALNENPAAAIHRIAQSYGLDLAQLYGGQSGSQSPGEAALIQQIRTLESQVNSLSSRAQTQEQRDAEARMQAVANEAESVFSEFAKSTPDYKDLEEKLADEVEILRIARPSMPLKEVLNQAWKKVSSTDETYAAKRSAALQVKAQEEAKKKADAAKKSASVNVRSVGVHSSNPAVNGKFGGDAWEAEMRAVARRLSDG